MLSGIREKVTLMLCWWECKLVQPLWRTEWRFIKKWKIELLYDPAIPLLGIYPEKTIIQKDTCSPMFTAALFTIARWWKQPKCPSTDDWIKKMWYIHTMEYYSAIKRNEVGSFVETWMDLETVIQSEVSLGWVDGWMVGWMDGWMVGWMDGWMEGWMDEWISRQEGDQIGRWSQLWLPLLPELSEHLWNMFVTYPQPVCVWALWGQVLGLVVSVPTQRRW